MNSRPCQPLRSLWLLCCALHLGALSGCALFKPATLPHDSGDYRQQQAQLSALQQWSLQGKLGIRLPDSAGSAYISWRQRAADYEIQLSGPLGQGNTLISGSAKEVSLARPGEELVTAASAEQLMYQTLGWWLPMSDMHYWVRGIASPGAVVSGMERNNNGTLLSLSQSGWQVNYASYQAVPPFLLPARLVISREEVKATLIIKHWKLPQ